MQHEFFPTAIHEAGHAVASVDLYGYSGDIDLIGSFNTDEWLGDPSQRSVKRYPALWTACNKFNGLYRVPDEPPERARHRAMCQFVEGVRLLSGPAAEFLFCHDGFPRIKAAATLRKYLEEGDGADDLKKLDMFGFKKDSVFRIWRATVSYVSDRRAAVMAVANAALSKLPGEKALSKALLHRLDNEIEYKRTVKSAYALLSEEIEKIVRKVGSND